MFYIIDSTTGEVLVDHPISASEVDRKLYDLASIHQLENLLVQADCESRYCLPADIWTYENL